MHRRTWTLPLGSALAALLIAGLALLAPRAAPATAPTSYTFQPLAQIGGMAGDIPIPQGLTWALGSLNDNGQILVVAETAAGTKPGLLLQYGDGKFTLLVSGGMDGPLGPWPKDIGFNGALYSMNGRGNSVFEVDKQHGATLIGTFYRDATSGKMTAVLLPGMPATGNLTFTNQSWGWQPVINNRDEIALPGQVKGTGSPSGVGLFFRTPDGGLQPIVVPGQALPDGTKGMPIAPSITDAGVVAFLAFVAEPSAYQWEKGNLTSLVTIGTAAPGGGKIAAVGTVLLNNQNSSALISARVTGKGGFNGPQGLYRLAGGTLTPVAVAGQPMPGGGTFKSIAFIANEVVQGGAVRAATEAGQHTFVATLADNSTGVYRLDADGTLSLVVKTGMTTPLGKVTRFGQYAGPAMNSKGQVVASISFDNGPDTLVLLTPATP
jgi:hypothetical protein